MEVTSEEVYDSYKNDIIIELRNDKDSDMENNI